MFDYTALGDSDLQKLAAQGDAMAEEALVRRYLPLVSLCAMSLDLRGGEKTDLTQEGVFGLINAVRSFDESNGASFRTYAEHCIRMRLLTAVKSASRLKHFPLNDSMSLEQLSEESDPRLTAVLENVHLNPEDVVLARERKEELYKALSDCLSKYEKTVFSLYLDGRSYQEIGVLLGKDQKSVDNALQRIRRKLARNLNLGDLSES